MTAALSGVRLVSLELRGFRAFGAESRTLDLDAPLVVIHAGNSQGKSSLAESIEFLLSGRSSRRELMGGAKAEYNDSLRNAYLSETDEDVYVEATFRTGDGTLHRARRELVRDFGQGSECESRLLLDGDEVADLEGIGLMLAEPPLRAPVLLQHTLRHVLSTEPKQRVGYFKALLALTDLDGLRDRIKAARSRLEAEASGSMLGTAERLTGTPAAGLGSTIAGLADREVDPEAAAAGLERGVREAAVSVLGDERFAGPGVTLSEIEAAARVAFDDYRERAFPVADYTPGLGPAAIREPNLGGFVSALESVDRAAATIAPVIEALLETGNYAALDQPADCPVCGTSHALTPERVRELGEHLHRTQEVDQAARAATDALTHARRELEDQVNAARRSVPAVAAATPTQLADHEAALRVLGASAEPATAARGASRTAAQAADDLASASGVAIETLDKVARCVAGRSTPDVDGLGADYVTIATAHAGLATALNESTRAATRLREEIGAATRDQPAAPGLQELIEVLAHRETLVAQITAEARRQKTIKRLTAADKTLREAAGRVLDTRFGQLSSAVTTWWSTIRPEELVSFGGVKRRAGGALFVNLTAALHAKPGSAPVEREALGVYSDSQLNALGLSIFLARSQFLGSPLVVLDDPIPGSDPEHRLTFVQNTLTALLDAGTQVVLTTFDAKLAEWANNTHTWRDALAYELDLLDAVAGTDARLTTDVFSQRLLEAEENLHAPTARGRRAACGSLRAAAERLAKQIVATGRSQDGQLTSVAEVHAEASQLGDLVPLASGYARDNHERGIWRTFTAVLNPGNHDDDVPDTSTLKQVRGNLRGIAKAHRAHWSGGLVH